jgi:2-polyprenyl-3-methyl-5-hydroxy-6-metoxy-1,4-benzoquinol methylase
MNVLLMTDNKIRKILKRIGMLPPCDHELYIEKMLGLGKDAIKYFDLIDSYVETEQSEPGQMVKIYRAKNKNIKVSLLASSQAYSKIYEVFLIWLESNLADTPKSIVEFGCDNGMLTQALKGLYPSAELCGIEKIKESVICAKKLADLNGVSTKFIQADIKKRITLDQSFDLVLIPFVLHEVELSNSEIFDNIKRLTNLDSLIITVNRFPEPEQAQSLKNSFEANNFINEYESYLYVDEERFPIQVFRKKTEFKNHAACLH